MNRLLPAMVVALALGGLVLRQSAAADPQEQPAQPQAVPPEQPAQPVPSVPAPAPVGAKPPGVAAQPGLVTIVTTYDPETQMMAMTLTLQAMQQGASARVPLCGPGGDLALTSPPASALAPQKPSGMSPRDVMQKIMQAGGPVEVCSIYVPNRNLGTRGLLPGVGQASPDAVAAHLIAPNTRILSF